MYHFDSSHPILTRGSRDSRAPPHHRLPAFLNLNGIFSCWNIAAHYIFFREMHKLRLKKLETKQRAQEERSKRDAEIQRVSTFKLQRKDPKTPFHNYRNHIASLLYHNIVSYGLIQPSKISYSSEIFECGKFSTRKFSILRTKN